MSDSHSIKMNKSSKPEDFTPVLRDMAKGINYKLVGFLCMIFLFLTSDIFMEKILDKFDGAVDFPGRSPVATSYGTILQMMLLALLYIVTDALIGFGII